jgi:hypothetical protein
VEGCCEHGKEPSGSVYCCEVLEWIDTQLASREGLSSVKVIVS